jgi:hypothetical protein
MLLVPDQGSSVKAFQIVTSGSIFDENKCIFTQGIFSSGKLNDPNGRVTNYSNVNVSIRQGGYQLGKEYGSILEYVFPKTLWDAFIDTTTPYVVSTRYTHTFNNGRYISTSETKNNVNIKAAVSKNLNNQIIAFSFSEIAE